MNDAIIHIHTVMYIHILKPLEIYFLNPLLIWSSGFIREHTILQNSVILENGYFTSEVSVFWLLCLCSSHWFGMLMMSLIRMK